MMEPRILVIDDDPLARLATEMFLKWFGVSCSIAETVEEGIELMQASPDRYSLILLDFNIPGHSIDSSIRTLRNICPTIRIVVRSGELSASTKNICLGSGADDYVEKCLPNQLLKARLTHWLQGSSVSSQVNVSGAGSLR